MIRENTIVRVRYTMKNGRGEVLENRSITYLHGSSSISSILDLLLSEKVLDHCVDSAMPR